MSTTDRIATARTPATAASDGSTTSATSAPSTPSTPSSDGSVRWRRLCPADRLVPDRGVAALVDGEPVAVFLLSTGDVHAVGNVDPCSGASVMSRGLVGEQDGVPTVASPLHKQRFDLRTGRCLDVPDVALAVRPVRIAGGHVELGMSSP